jgi:hypothetical protein
VKLLDLIYHHKYDHLSNIRISAWFRWKAIGSFLGLITAFLISLLISRKQNWYWVNSVFVLSISFLSGRVGAFGWRYLKIIFLKPGSFFGDYTIGDFLTNGLVMLAIGLLLFFLPGSIQFIKSGKLKKQSLKQEAEES